MTRAASAVSEGVEVFAAAAAKMARHDGERVPHWLQALRKEASERFQDIGFPSQREERWRFTDTGPIARQAWQAAGSASQAPLRARSAPFGAFTRLAPVTSPSRRNHQLVFVNGRLDAELSAVDGLPAGVRFDSIARLLASEPSRLQPFLGLAGAHRRHPFAALNTSFLSDGACLVVDAGVVCAEPFHAVFVTDPGAGPVASHPRSLVVLGENAQASVVESFTGPDGNGDGKGNGKAPTFVNALSELYLGPHAMLDQTTLQEEGSTTFHVGTLWAHQDRGGQLCSHLFSIGGDLVRNELSVALHGGGAGTTLDGLFLAKGTQRVDNQTLIDHARPHCGSQEYFKGILDGKARGAFEGKIVVRPHAVKTDAHQKNRNLILSREALVDTKPQLEIYNDDVKCTHGSSTGRLDADAMFYLRSRGLSEASARALLTGAFASEIAARAKVEAVRQYLDSRVAGWFSEEAEEAVEAEEARDTA